MIASTADAMRAAIVAAMPELAGLPATVHDGGWDSVGVEVGGWLCKFPRDGDGADALRREAALLSVLRPRLTMPVPDMTIVDGPPLFSRHPILSGRPVATTEYRDWPEDRRGRLAQDVARFLAEIHAVEHDWASLGIGPEDEERDGEEADALLLLPPEIRPAAARMIADHAALGPDPLGEGLCYLDAHGRNFAFDDRAGRLAGIYDFGDSAVAPRHEEFVEPACIARDCARRVIAAYEDATGRIVDRRRVDLLIGRQRLDELADDADHPRHGPVVRALARDWFRAPTLDAADAA